MRTCATRLADLSECKSTCAPVYSCKLLCWKETRLSALLMTVFSVVSGCADIVVIFWLILLHEDFVTRPID